MIIKENTDIKISTAQDIARILADILDLEDEVDRDKEHFWTIGLTTCNTIKFIDLVALGTLNNALIHPREVFRLAIMKAVDSIIVGHNHPSGNLTASRDDIAITERLKSAGDIIGIRLTDHVIISNKGKCTSLLEKGIL